MPRLPKEISPRDIETEFDRLRHQEALFEATQKFLRLGYCEWDFENDRLKSCTKEYAKIFGMSIDEIIESQSSWQKTLTQIHPDDLENYITTYREIGGKESYQVSYRIIPKDGAIRHVKEASIIVHGADGKHSNSISMLQDITELKKHKRGLEKRDVLIQQFELVPGIGHYIWNLDTEEYLYVSSGLTDIYGLLTTDFLRRVSSFKDDIELLHEDDRERMQELYADRKTNDEADLEYRIRRPNGEIRWIREKSISIWDSDSTSNQAIGVLKDVTEQKEAEQTLRHSRDLLETQVLERTRQLSDTIKQLELEIAERERIAAELKNQNAELERFAYTVSHDLKTPLVTINGFLGILAKEISASDRDRVTGHIEKISNAANTMGTLLNDLLELSRVGRIMGEQKTCDLRDIVKQALDQVTIRVQQQGIEILVGDMPEVFGDEMRLVEVFVNLVENAIKFMGDQIAPQIQIGSVDKAGMICYYVRDNGIGISPEFHEKVFGLFERLDASPEGTGVGLALVKRIVEVHGGEIWVESEGTGQGSGFLFTLPKS